MVIWMETVSRCPGRLLDRLGPSSGLTETNHPDAVEIWYGFDQLRRTDDYDADSDPQSRYGVDHIGVLTQFTG